MLKKKIIGMILILALVLGTITACGRSGEKNENKMNIVCAIFPIYDWVREIVKETTKEVEVTWLMNQGVDLHSFQPTARDIITIASCDLFIYVGGESDAWVEKALEESTNEKRIVINLMEVLGDRVKQEERVEGMQDEHHHEEVAEEGIEDTKEEHAEDTHEEHTEAVHEEEADEHIWLSMINTEVFCKEIAEQVAKVDLGNEAVYQKNMEDYISKLRLLDEKYCETTRDAAQDTLVFADRFPFRYLTEDYGLKYYAAFPGCSAETEASFETVIFLSNRLDELGVKSVLTIEGTKHKLAETVISNTKEKNQGILVLDSLQSINQDDADSGVTYLSVMEKNLEILRDARIDSLEDGLEKELELEKQRFEKEKAMISEKMITSVWGVFFSI